MQRTALCRSRRELSNEYLLAKIGLLACLLACFDTAPRTNLVKFARSPRAQIPQVLVRGARVLRAEPVPEVELLPSDDVPSDHLPLVAELAAN